jgi:hypothetical protein
MQRSDAKCGVLAMKNKYIIMIFAILILAISANAFFFIVLPVAETTPHFVRIYFKSGAIVRDTLSISDVTLNDIKIQYLKVNNTKIFPDETDSIIVNGYAGIPMKTTWLFKLVEGAITLYTNDPVSYFNPIGLYNLASFYNYNKIVAQQFHQGPIIPYSLDTLKQWVKNKEWPSYYCTFRTVNDTRIKPDPIRAAFEYNTKHYERIATRNNLMERYKKVDKDSLSLRIRLLNQICAVDSTYDDAYWRLGEIYRTIDTAKACGYYAKFIKHNFYTIDCKKALRRIAEIDPAFEFSY